MISLIERGLVYMKKRIFSTFIFIVSIFITMLIISPSVSAMEKSNNGEIISTKDKQTNTDELVVELEIRTLDVDPNKVTDEQINLLISEDVRAREVQDKSISSKNISPYASTTTQAYVYRIGTGTTCQISLRWSGSIMVSNYRYNSLKIKSTSDLNSTIYDTLDYKFMTATPAALAGTVYAGTFSVPTSVSKIKLDFSGLQLYDMASGWISVWGIRSAPIN